MKGPANNRGPLATAPGAGADIAALVRALRDELRLQERRRLAEIEPPPEPAPIAPVAPAILEAMTRRYGLPSAYVTFLRAIGARGFSIVPGPFQELIIYAAPELERAQVGFRGSRPGDEGFIAPHGWRRGWVVIAYDNGDPYFLDVSKGPAGGDPPVWTAMHGTGTWEPRLAASSLAQFLQILRVWARIVVPQYDPQNPDEPLDDAHLRRLTTEITQIDAAAADHWTI
jgi:hypothetical protein